MKKGSITKLWQKAQTQIKSNQLKEAEETLDRGIVYLAQYTIDGKKDNELIEGVTKSVWLERFWIAIQNHIWPTYPDYEENWKC